MPTPPPGYQVLETLYESPRTVVHRALRESDETSVILKQLKALRPSQHDLVQYRHEYEVAHGLQGSGIIGVLDLIDHLHRLILVEEDFGGRPISSLIADGGLELQEFLELAILTTEAVAQLHGQGVVHKDVTPANILWNRELEQLKLIDFGLATRHQGQRPRDPKTDDVEGTLAYMSPEQTGRTSRLIDYRTDFYSLGATFYQMATGHLPFDAGDAAEWVHCHLARQPVPAQRRRADLPPVVAEIIERLMAKSPEERYQSAHGLQVDLERCLELWRTTGDIASFELGSRDAPATLQISRKLYGRDEELETLRDRFENACQGQAGLVLVSGPGGVGKSALVAELQGSITAQSGWFVSGKFAPGRHAVPYSAFSAGFERLISQLLAQTATDVGRWRARLEETLGDDAGLLVQLMPGLRTLLGASVAPKVLDPTEASHRFRRALRRFVGGLCQPGRPMTLFLDDLQWADAPSLQLLETLIFDPELTELLVIGTYRSEEVGPAHPLTGVMESATSEGVRLDHLCLAPLGREHVHELLVDTLRCAPERAIEFAELVHRKTSGNPFFVSSFLERLVHDALLWFDSEQGRWCWDQAEIEAAGITENVVELVVARLGRLPEASLDPLRYAALLGTPFELDALALVCEMSAPEVFALLQPSLDQGVLQRHGEEELADPREPCSPVVIRRMAFAHDRVQEAAAQLFDPTQRIQAHLTIGRLLQADLSREPGSPLLFEVVSHLNEASKLLTDTQSILELVGLNLRAGQKALAELAFPSSVSYLRKADELLRQNVGAETRWKDHRDLAASVALEHARAEALIGELAACESLSRTALDYVDEPVQRAEFYGLLIRVYALRTEFDRAAQAAREGLALFGIELPLHALDDQVEAEFVRIDDAFSRLDVADIDQLPHVENPTAEAALSLLAIFEPAAGLLDFRLLHLVGLKATGITLEIGVRPQSLTGLSQYGVLLSLRGRALQGARIGQKAVEIAHRSGNESILCHTLFINAAMLMPWSRSLRECLPLLGEAHRAGLRSGNALFAGWSLSTDAMYRAMLGEELSGVLHRAERATAFGRDSGHLGVYEHGAAYQAVARNLLGLTDDPTVFDSPEFGSAEALLEDCRQHGNLAVYVVFQIARAQSAYIDGDSPLALELLEDVEGQLDPLVGTLDTGRHPFYLALVLVDLMLADPTQADPTQADPTQADPTQADPTQADPTQASRPDSDAFAHRRARVQALRDTVADLAEQCPPNFEHKRLLLDAECARLDDEYRQATQLYDRAIEEARNRGLTHMEALANERAALFWLAEDKPDFAASYLREAIFAYDYWGATRKVEQLRDQYTELLEEASGEVVSYGAEPTAQVPIDITSVFKASESIAAKLELAELLPTLMEVTLENAGAQRGAFFLVDGEDVRLAVEDTANTEPRRLLPPVALADWSNGARSIVRYVVRTRAILVAGRATRDPRFADDPYFKHTPARSILCMPVEEHGELAGVLYLENNLAEDAFTEDRTRVLQILAGHIAVSLNKARLYDELKENEERFRQLAENIQEAFWLMDWPSQQIVYVSPAYEAIWKRSVPTELVGLDTWLEPVLPRYRADVAAKLRDKASSGGYEATYQIERPSGTLRWIHDRGFPIKDRDGNTYRIAGVAIDITRRHEVKQMKDEFISIVSHELRTPLTPITGIFHMLATSTDEELSQRSRQMVELGLRNSRRLLDIIDDLLDMQKLSLEKVDFDIEPLGLTEVVREALDLNSALGEVKQVRVEFDEPKEPLYVEADRSRLLQVLTNLLSNAVKFSNAGDPIEVRVERTDSHVRISVRDHGSGIPEEAREHIFEKFTQADSSLTRRHGGTGLGLTIAKSIVERLGGHIDFETATGEGTTFYVEFPRAQP
jgi:PAS domain S-box-containing protein